MSPNAMKWPTYDFANKFCIMFLLLLTGILRFEGGNWEKKNILSTSLARVFIHFVELDIRV